MGYNVYDPAQRSYRVNFACAYILAGRGKHYDSRHFDTCFEMHDSHEVAARVYRRALKNTALMAALPRYLDVALCAQDYQTIFGASNV